VAAIVILERDVRAAGLRHPAALNLDAVEHRRSQLWTIAFVVMTFLAVGTTLLSEAVPRLAEDVTVGMAPAAARLGLLGLVAGLVVYVSEKERHLRRLTRLLLGSAPAGAAVTAERDPLTGLLDRDAFQAQLIAAIDASRRQDEALALLLVDVDRFREINNRHGHRPGDLLLQELARRIKATAPTAATARLRSDEFGLLMSGTTGGETRDLARRLSQILRQPVRLGDGQLVVTCTTGGVVQRAGQHDLPEDLLRDAVLARRLAQARGRGQWEIFDRVTDESR